MPAKRFRFGSDHSQIFRNEWQDFQIILYGPKQLRARSFHPFAPGRCGGFARYFPEASKPRK